ncbi:tRNA(m(1)G37)methyltransferase [Coemansia javaensis]|uniref:tRNA (guanine(37)-N1)-methyltransferase n=1 Tax=Coemansia javaensis TaxID=2761396 RepID=A0A9W8LHB9_9FUNG|nr:tRNA(m(1)G37)methyltransferase [Coemansia javaensis]
MALRPPSRRGMKELDRGAFSLTIPVVALRVPAKSIGKIRAELGGDILRIPKMRNVVDDQASKTHKMVLLKPEITRLDEASAQLVQLARENSWEAVAHEVTVGYDHWTADEVLRAVLPDETQAPTSYEQVGHIAHMNLRDEYLEYKTLIGQVILDKSPTVKLVVNKLDTIDSTFRNFKMEVLAGEDAAGFVATVRENDCVFRFDFSKVYWNSRLHPEHERLSRLFAAGSSVCDVMAGVGPFAIPAARRGALVWANDLNPASYEALCDNIQRNKAQDRVRAFNMDGRDFIRTAFADYHALARGGSLTIPPLPRSNASRTRPQAEPPIPVASRSFDHVVMNLPAIAIEFLDAFRGLFRQITGAAAPADDGTAPNLPLIHAHCFTKSSEPERDILQRACRALGYPEDGYQELDATIHYVRKVAPNKDMYCLSLRLPVSVAYAALPEPAEDAESNGKRKSADESSDSRKTLKAEE